MTTPGRGRHGPIRSIKRMTPEQIRQRLEDKGIDPEHPFRGMTLDDDEQLRKLSPGSRRAELERRKKREMGDYTGALREAAEQQGPGMPRVYSYGAIARTAAMAMHNSSEQQGSWNLNTWWEWIHAGQNTGLLTMDDDEIEQKFLVDPKGYNLIWDWIHQYEATTGIKLEPNYTINLRGGLQRGPITGSRLHEAQEQFEDPSIGYSGDRPITIDPNSPRYRNR